MPPPEDDTYRCPDCNGLILRKDFCSHPGVCVHTVCSPQPHRGVIYEYDQVESANDFIQNFDNNLFQAETKSPAKQAKPRKVKYNLPIGQYSCASCDMVFRTTSGRKQHQETIHEGIRRFKCELCAYKTTTNFKLNLHKKSKHKSVRALTGNYHCISCDMRFRTANGRWHHYRFVHEDVKYKCDQCEYKCSTLFVLKTHQQCKHEGVTYNCDQCEYKATQKSNLKRHKMIQHKVNTLSKL